MVSLFFTVGILSLVFWLLPAIRQYKTDLFFYFLILALMDPLVMLARFSPVFIMYNVYVILSFLMLLMFVYLNMKKIFFYIFASVSLILSVLSFYASMTYCYDLLVITHIGILFFFIRRALFFVAANSNVNIFQIVLILYETSVILKILTFLTNAEVGQLYHLVTTVFQIFIAVFLTIFKEDNPRMSLKINRE